MSSRRDFNLRRAILALSAAITILSTAVVVHLLWHWAKR